MTIRTKLNVFYGMLLTVVMGLASGGLYVTERRLLLSEMENTRASLLAGFSQSCRDALLVHDELTAINAALSIGKNPSVLEAYCVDPAGRIVAHSNPTRRGFPYLAPSVPTVSLEGGGQQGRWRQAEGDAVGVFKDLPLKPGRPARAVIVFSEKVLNETVEKALTELGRRILTVFSMALFLGLLGTFFLAQSLTRPLQRIAVGARALASGNLRHRIEEKGKDEIAQLATDFNTMAVRLGELDQMKNDFVSNVTHELRSPLSAIESYANLVTEDWRGGRSQNLVEYFTIVRNNATRLRKFVTDILDISKIDAASVEIEKERFLVHELFQEIVELFQANSMEKGVELTWNVSPGLSLLADMDKVRQVLTNLTSNALKFTPRAGKVILTAQGGLRPSAEVGLTESFQSGKAKADHYTRLSVTDTGPGIPERDQKRIFDRFEQVKEMRESVEGQKGTGLGLAIVRQLVVAHGGFIHLTSEVGRGSTFSVYFPEGG